jgi:hypothetical protein
MCKNTEFSEASITVKDLEMVASRGTVALSKSLKPVEMSAK